MCLSAEFAQPSVCVFPQLGLFSEITTSKPANRQTAGCVCRVTAQQHIKQNLQSGCSAALLTGWNAAVYGRLCEYEVGLDFLAAAACQCRRSLKFENDERRAWRPTELHPFEEAAVAPLLGNKMMLTVCHCEMEVHDSNSWLVTPAPAIPLVLCCKRGQFVHFIKERVFS